MGKSDPSSSKSKYCGDYLIDLPESFHDANYNTKNLRREKGHPILFMFYKVSANYVGKFRSSNGTSKEEVYFEKGDNLYIPVNEKFPLITFSIATPLGGPVFETRVNNAVVEIVKANSIECEKFIEKLNRGN